MVRCRVLLCKSDSERKEVGVSFHAFPDYPDLHLKWIEATGRKNWTPKKYCKICSKHFQENVLIKKKLRVLLHPDAVPNVTSTPEQSDNPVPSTSTSGILKDEQSVFKIPGVDDDKITKSIATDASVPSTSASVVTSKQYTDDTNMKKATKRKLRFANCECESEDTPRKKKLKTDLKKKLVMVEGLRKKLRAVRQSKSRLIKRNSYLTDIIRELKLKSLISGEDADILNTIDAGNTDFGNRRVG